MVEFLSNLEKLEQYIKKFLETMKQIATENKLLKHENDELKAKYRQKEIELFEKEEEIKRLKLVNAQLRDNQEILKNKIENLISQLTIIESSEIADNQIEDNKIDKEENDSGKSHDY